MPDRLPAGGSAGSEPGASGGDADLGDAVLEQRLRAGDSRPMRPGQPAGRMFAAARQASRSWSR
jgi:hypothetical protein